MAYSTQVLYSVWSTVLVHWYIIIIYLKLKMARYIIMDSGHNPQNVSFFNTVLGQICIVLESLSK